MKNFYWLEASHKKALMDFLIIIVGFIIMYYTLNNNYVRPQLSTDDLQAINNWSINKREHKLLFGLSGHTYLELMDNNGQVIEQLHGFAYDENTGEIIERATNNGYKLKAFVFSYDYYQHNGIGTESDFPGLTIESGEAQYIRDIWGNIKFCAATVNNENIEYPKYGFKILNETENSNSVTHSALLCAGLTDRDLGLFTPGEHTDIISKSQ